MNFLIVADVFSKYIIVRKLPNSTSTDVCTELPMIVTELGLPHIIGSDNDPCYNSKEFQQFLQCYNIIHQTSSPNHPREGNKPERSYIKLAQGTPVWIQHRQNATWEPATVINQCALNSYWVMQEYGTEQPKVYRHTRTMLKIRCTPTEGKQTGQMKEWMTESRSESIIPAIRNTIRDSVYKNFQQNTSSDTVQLPLPRLDFPQAPFESSEDREETAESLCTDETALETTETNGQNTPYTPGSCKSTRKNFGKPASSFSDF